ncbi:MAG: trypsin-like peptidase domain-containing protein [Clostridia bacterium]|nr:trypsin-like peptidase domain-containing protein [Clostridia bacterium]
MYENEQNGSGFERRAEYYENAEKPAKRSGFGKRIFTLVLCAVIFGAVAGAVYAGLNKLFSAPNAESNKAAVTAQPTETPMQTADSGAQSDKVIASVGYSQGESLSAVLDVSSIAEGAMPAMVSITNISVQEVQSYFGLFGWGQPQTQQLESSGTGIIIGTNDSELLVVTNNHVVEDATTLSVCFVDDEVCEAVVKGTDPDNDLAVIAVKLSDIKESTTQTIRRAQVGDSDSLKVGQQVVAIGNALGYGQSVTTGIVSALGRRIDTTDAIMIQTDAAINPGNSGGALLNMKGELVGINSAKFSSTEVEGMGYAIAITPATPIIEDLMNRTTREKVSSENASYLGVRGEDITSSISASYGIPQGIYVTSLGAGSPAAEAGITAKSIITHFDGIRVTSLSNLENRLQYYAAGESVEVTVQVLEGHEYVEKTLTVTLGRAADHLSQGGYGYGRP